MGSKGPVFRSEPPKKQPEKGPLKSINSFNRFFNN